MDTAQDIYLQYALRRGEILAIADRFADALEEDRHHNADMFDTRRLTFSKNQHPNRTMRALESDLQKADAPLLCLLSALSKTGMELVQHLADFPSPTAFAVAAGEQFALLSAKNPPAAHLARELTEIKAEHALRRLTAAIRMLDQMAEE